MSMNTYGGMITGLVIKKEYIDDFMEKYIRLHPEHFKEGLSHEEMKEEMEADLCCNERFIKSAASDKNDCFYAQLYDDDPFYDTASMYHMNDINDWHEDLEMPFILVDAEKPLLTKNVLEGKFYKSKEELIHEFRDKLAKYLPKDFDYEGNIGDVEYAVFC